MNKNSIIVRLFGGLGNQLFIYVFARSMALNLNREVSLDIKSGFPKDSFKRKYLLNNFYININKVSILQSAYFPLKKRSFILSNLFFPDSLHFTESEDILNVIKMNVKKKIFLEGYWQNTKYFDNVSDNIRNDLRIKCEINRANLMFVQKIKDGENVAVHVRRVDYSSRLPLSYYYNAIKQLDSKLSSANYYIFSDDIEWCKANIKVENRTFFIDHNNGDEIQDFWLMTQCKHFIIANSTFSWWAAWLSDNKNKLIVKPTNYIDFNFPTFNA